MIVRAASQAHLEWLVNRIGLCPRADIRGIVAVDQRERVRGGVLYEGWTQSSVQVHMASEAPIVWRHLLRPAMRYPFVDCGKSVPWPQSRSQTSRAGDWPPISDLRSLAGFATGARFGTTC